MALKQRMLSSLDRLRALRDRTTLNILTISLTLAIILGAFLFLYWEQLTGAFGYSG
jgi:hypothetical protein